jgi:hypothetical protein
MVYVLEPAVSSVAIGFWCHGTWRHIRSSFILFSLCILILISGSLVVPCSQIKVLMHGIFLSWLISFQISRSMVNGPLVLNQGECILPSLLAPRHWQWWAVRPGQADLGKFLKGKLESARLGDNISVNGACVLRGTIARAVFFSMRFTRSREHYPETSQIFSSDGYPAQWSDYVATHGGFWQWTVEGMWVWGEADANRLSEVLVPWLPLLSGIHTWRNIYYKHHWTRGQS